MPIVQGVIGAKDGGRTGGDYLVPSSRLLIVLDVTSQDREVRDRRQ